MSELRLAIVGFGKIAHDQHVPAIAATDGVTLVAVADPNPVTADVPHFRSLEALLRDGPEIDAVALATPPQIRRAQATIALAARKHVFMEKPPARAVTEIAPLVTAAREAKRTLFQSWHARFSPAVEPARRLLAERKIERVFINWKEDVRVWHPGQDWIFEVLVDEKKQSYQSLYRRFVELVAAGESDVDLSPLQLVADAFMLGRRREVEAFAWRVS